MGHVWILLLLGGLLWMVMEAAEAEETRIDLTHAVLLTPANLSGPEQKAVTMLVEEVEKRTRLRWPVVHALPTEKRPVIAVGQGKALAPLFPALSAELTAPNRPEGFHLHLSKDLNQPLLVAGQDARGVLFGVGYLLRKLSLERDRVTAPEMNLTTAPSQPLRGHQLGYRPKTNSYDAWTLPMWEQYLRDLAVFGTNAVELVPPRTDDDADSPHFPLPPMEMMVGMSQLLADYGLDCWIWFPAMDKDYTDPATVTAALQEWGAVFRRLPRVDAVFVPGGDPGHTQPKVLMAFLEKATAELHRHHPKAGMWVSPQGFTQAWMDEFLTILQKEQPAWLQGVVFGPQVRLPLARLRQLVPKQYPIRHYPDITHCRQCQFPVPDWDTAFALTEGREPINPRPVDQAHLFRTFEKETVGFLTYSEGCNDDVNKVVWSALGWNRDADLHETLQDYGRYFISPRSANAFAEGLLALERNWRGPLLSNTGVTTTLQQFQAMERDATPAERLSWRFQQALYRAYYDAYLRSRLVAETQQEEQAMECLRTAAQRGTNQALAEAEAILGQAETHPVAQDYRTRIFALAEALFQSIRMQLSVEKYQAIAIERGANLDSVDAPLNNRLWLRQRFAEIRLFPTEAERLKAIGEIVHWTNPTPGGFYDEPGNPLRRPHLVSNGGFQRDPGHYEEPRVGFTTGLTGRLSWSRHIETLYDAPLQMVYRNLAPNTAYRVRVLYASDSPERPIRLAAGEKGEFEIHPPLPKPRPIRLQEFPIPPAAISNGTLRLTWTGEPGRGGNGRGCQVSEVWLLPQDKEQGKDE